MKEIKGKLTQAFDEGHLEELLKNDPGLIKDPEAAELSRSLLEIELALQNPPDVFVPAGFTAAVMGHLPAIDFKEIKIINLRDVLIPLIIGITLILSFIFSEPLGLTKLMTTSSSYLNTVGTNDLQVVFVTVSCAGILAIAWLVVSSFFGVRSRRVTEYRYK